MSVEGNYFFRKTVEEPLVEEIKRKLEIVPKEVLEKIIAEYESASFLEKFKRGIGVLFYEPHFYKKHLEYFYAKNRESIKEMEKKEESRGEKERLNGEHIKRGMQVELFLGSLEEFERLKNAKYEILDTGENRKFIVLSDRHPGTYRRLGELDADALINVRRNDVAAFLSNLQYRGIPVRRKN